ncbi:MAG: amino acid ABC transporter substrate-binding protein [Acidimicrobiales bacterium]
MRGSRKIRLAAVILALVLTAAACGDSSGGSSTNTTDGDAGDTTTEVQAGQAPGGALLATVQDRGTLNCGVNETVPGFGIVDESGDFSGFDIDYCRAIAAAVIGDANAVDFTPLTSGQRFTALQSGEIDVLIRNTTWTASRDGTEGATFLHTTFFDGQGMMVKSDSTFQTVEDMDGASICVLSGTTTELNLADIFSSRGMSFEGATYESNDELRPAFIADQCDGWTTDKSQLASFRAANPEDAGGPDAWRIMDETFSKEPLGPVVRDGDSQWAQVVDWVVLATINAEEFGINQGNVGTFADTENPSIRTFLGLAGSDGSVADLGLGIDSDANARIIEQVGNYADIYDRNLTPLGLARGVNSLWTDGGLLYGPPFR